MLTVANSLPTGESYWRLCCLHKTVSSTPYREIGIGKFWEHNVLLYYPIATEDFQEVYT